MLYIKIWWFLGASDGPYNIFYFGYQLKGWSWSDLIYFFYKGNLCEYLKDLYSEYSFFTAKYRPIVLILHAIKYSLFCKSIYYHFLVSVFFYALNGTLLFNIFTWITNYYTAFFATILFTFNPMVSFYFGRIGQLDLSVTAFFMLLALIFFKKYLDIQKIRFYFFSCFFFIISLLTREIVFVLPVIIFFGTYLYQNRNKSFYSIKDFFRKIIHILKTTSAFFVINIIYLGVRLFLYPVNFSKLKGTLSLEKYDFNLFMGLKNFIYTMYIYAKLFIYDLLGFSFVFWNQKYKFIKISLFITILSLLIWIFIKNTKKIYVLYFLCSFFLMSWMIFLKQDFFFFRGFGFIPYNFLFLALVFLFKFYKGKLLRFKKLGFILLCFITIFFITLNVKIMFKREKHLHIRKKAFLELVNDVDKKNKRICFFGFPEQLFTHFDRRTFMLLLGDENAPVYFDFSTSSVKTDGYVDCITGTTFFANKYYSKTFFDGNYMDIKPIKNGFRLVSLNPKKLFFKDARSSFINEESGLISLGKKVIHKIEMIKGRELVTDFSIIIDPKYLINNFIFVTWDYKNSKFKILDMK